MDHAARKAWKSAAETGEDVLFSPFYISEKFSSITEMKRLLRQ